MGEQRRCQAEEPEAALLSSWITMCVQVKLEEALTLLSRGSGHLATRVSRVTRKEGGGDCNCKLGTQNWPLRGHPFYTSAISAKPTDQDRTLGFLMLQRLFQPSRPGWKCTCIRCLVANCFPDVFLCLPNKVECFTAKRFARTMSYVLICFF